MNYLVISPYYPQNFQQFTVELANKGITVLGIGQEPYEQLDQSLKDALTEYFRVDNLENLDEVKRAVAFLFYKHGPIDRIESHNEYWLELDAALREQFNVFGAKPEDLKKTKFKSEMKKLFQKAGVPVVPGAVIKTDEDVDKAVKEIGLPMIAKPDNGVGAAATFKLETEDDINHFKAEWDRETVYFFEKFVNSSEICTFDGLVDRNGNIVFSTTFDYAHTPLDLMIYKMDNSYYVLKEMNPKLRKYGEAIVKEFGMKERFFHIEFFRDGDDILLLSTIIDQQVVSRLMYITMPILSICTRAMQISLLVIHSLDLTLNHFIVWRLHVVQVLIMLIQRKNFSTSIVNNSKLRKSCQLPLQSYRVTTSIC